MKKFFTFAAALMASVAMMAADFEPTAVYKVGDATTLGPQWKSGQNNIVDYFEVGDTVIFSPYLLYQSAATGYQEWTGCAGSGSTGTTWNAMGCFKGSSAWFTSSAKAATTRSTRQYFYNVTNCSEVSILVKSGSSSVIALSAYELKAGVVDSATVVSQTYNTGSNGILTLTGLDMTKTYRIVVNSNKDSNSNYYEIAFVGKASTDPILAVNPESVALNATASNTNPSAKVTFSGKNLAAGNYALSVPDLSGLTVSPASVTVGEDGKLNAEVTISYTSAVEVAAASTSVDLTIGALTKVVVVNYSATLTKKYMKSMNIEQLVLDNGTSYDIKAAFDAANIEYQNIDALDTLNDLENKTNRNYAFLGLKMKKTDAKLAGWLKAGQTIKVRFGNVGANFKVSAMGMDSTCTAENFANTSVESNKVLEFTAPIDMYLEIVCNSTKTLVIKQVMINQEIAPVVLPAPSAYLITIQAGEHGKVTATWENKQYRTPVGALVTLTPQPDEGYKTVSLTWNGTPLYDDHVGYVTFIMPAEDVTVVAAFDTDFPTDVENVENAEISIQKRIVNGQMVIIRGEQTYTVQGQIVK